MAQVRAKVAVYLGPTYGYRTEGEEFPYEGPAHKYLEPLETPKETASGRKQKSDDKDA